MDLRAHDEKYEGISDSYPRSAISGQLRSFDVELLDETSYRDFTTRATEAKRTISSSIQTLQGDS
jgi:hypothetical protein